MPKEIFHIESLMLEGLIDASEAFANRFVIGTGSEC